jgi:polyisoprenoid-binding protein YceI
MYVELIVNCVRQRPSVMIIFNFSTRAYALIPLLFFIVLAANGQKPYSLKTYKVTIDGTSSLHEWTSDVTKLEWSGIVATEGNSVKSIKDAVVTIKVVSIKSTKGKTMDNKTYEAFNSDKNPDIVFKLTNVTVNGADVQATGSLTMNGNTKSISMMPTAKVLPGGEVQITGNQKLNMKDYKMVPPKAMMGTIKVGEEVTVKYDLILTASK